MAHQKLCAVSACSKPSRSKGYCVAHYTRLWRYGLPEAGDTQKGAPLAWLFEQLGHRTDDCLTWPFATLNNGYASVRYEGRVQVASRVMCEKVHGLPPEDWYETAHSCGNGHLACVNPLHLIWKTPVDNRRDKRDHGTQTKGSKHPSAKLNEHQVQYIRAMIGKSTLSKLAKELGVSASLVSMIQSGQGWAHVS